MSRPEHKVKSENSTATKVGQDDLSYLNAEHAYPNQYFKTASNLPAHKKLLISFFRKIFRGLGLEDVFQAQSNYNAHLVRHLNSISEKINKDEATIEDDLRSSFYALEKSLNSKIAENLKDNEELQKDNNRYYHELKAQTDTLNSVVRGLERIVSLKGRVSQETAEVHENEQPELDHRYVLLENRYRGSEEVIKQRVSIYDSVFDGLGEARPILEVGCGRGELQEVFKESGKKSYGVEMDAAMVALCESKGFEVVLADAMAHMSTLEDRSLDGVIALQVVEHLTSEQLSNFLSLCRTKVAKGGKIVFETINTQSMLALCHNYFRDPTHTAPLHPDTMKEIVEQAGLEVKELRFLSPYPEGAQFRELEINSVYPPHVSNAFEVLNQNVSQLNSLIFGHQDYCLIAQV